MAVRLIAQRRVHDGRGRHDIVINAAIRELTRFHNNNPDIKHQLIHNMRVRRVASDEDYDIDSSDEEE